MRNTPVPHGTSLITVIDEVTRLLAHETLPVVIVEREGSWLSVFSPEHPDVLAPTYIRPLAEMAFAAHKVHGGSVLHLGGAGMTAARALAHHRVDNTVVDLDEALCTAIVERYPVDEHVKVIYGDARDLVAELAPLHATTIVDMGGGLYGPPEVELASSVVKEISAARSAEAPTTVLVNLLLALDESKEPLVSEVTHVLSRIGDVVRFDGGESRTGPNIGNTLMMTSSNPEMDHVLAHAEWPKWRKVPVRS